MKRSFQKLFSHPSERDDQSLPDSTREDKRQYRCIPKARYVLPRVLYKFVCSSLDGGAPKAQDSKRNAIDP